MSISNTLLFLRISFPNDIDYGKEDWAEPESKQDEYFIPFIHRKTVISSDKDKEE